jgi:cystathionine beta-lyase
VHYPGTGIRGKQELTDKGVRGAGGVLAFEVAKGVNPSVILNNLHVFRLAVSLGAVESLAELPCRMTHFEIPREERLKLGITDELIRLAIGIEDADDLVEDLRQAFALADKELEDESAERSVPVLR